MKIITLLLSLVSVGFAQAQAPAPAPQEGPIITWADANDQDYNVPNGYGGYYYGGGYYGYGGGYGGRGGIGTTIQMAVMRIVATTVVQIALGEVGAVVVRVGGASLLLL